MLSALFRGLRRCSPFRRHEEARARFSRDPTEFTGLHSIITSAWSSCQCLASCPRVRAGRAWYGTMMFPAGGLRVIEQQSSPGFRSRGSHHLGMAWLALRHGRRLFALGQVAIELLLRSPKCRRQGEICHKDRGCRAATRLAHRWHAPAAMVAVRKRPSVGGRARHRGTPPSPFPHPSPATWPFSTTDTSGGEAWNGWLPHHPVGRTTSTILAGPAFIFCAK